MVPPCPLFIPRAALRAEESDPWAGAAQSAMGCDAAEGAHPVRSAAMTLASRFLATFGMTSFGKGQSIEVVELLGAA